MNRDYATISVKTDTQIVTERVRMMRIQRGDEDLYFCMPVAMSEDQTVALMFEAISSTDLYAPLSDTVTELVANKGYIPLLGPSNAHYLRPPYVPLDVARSQSPFPERITLDNVVNDNRPMGRLTQMFKRLLRKK
jgi:hypothetical protein